MTVLILSEDNDYHGVSVNWGLRQLGVDVEWWQRSMFPARQHVALRQVDTDSRLSVDGSRIGEKGLRAVWMRRGGTPKPREDLIDADRRVAKIESRVSLHAFARVVELLNPAALLVNPVASIVEAETKGCQL